MATEKKSNDVIRLSDQPEPPALRTLTASLRKLPDFLVIGAQKAGSTSLYHKISVNLPNFEPAYRKEVHYFDRRINRGINYYRSFFPIALLSKLKGTITGEATPYYLANPMTPREVHKLIPNVKLIAILRNPVDRAYSNYQHVVRRGKEDMTFEEAIAQEDKRIGDELKQMLAVKEFTNGLDTNYLRYSYKTRGLYAMQLKWWYEFFPKEQILVVSSSEFFKKPKLILERIKSFLEVSGDLKGNYIFKKKESREVKYPPMQESTRKELIEFFKPHNQELYKLIGQEFDWDK